MASNHISKLTIAGLRGVARSLELNLNKPLTLVYGENGTGKTSICDAVDLLGNGVAGSLRDISAGSSKHKFWPFIGARDLDIQISLELKDGNNWAATCAGKSVNVSNEDSRPIVKVWRRKQLMDLIVASPSARFSVISPFIDLSEIEKSEQKLRDLQSQVDRELNTASNKITENLNFISRLRDAQEETAQSNLQWARDQLVIPVEDVDAEITAIDKVTTTISTLTRNIEDLALQGQQAEQAQAKETEALAENERVKDQFDQKVAETLEVLKAAKNYFHQHTDAEECPLCLSRENIKGLDADINQKLESLSEVQQASNTLSTATRKREQTEGRVEEAQTQADKAFESLQESLNGLEPYPEAFELTRELYDATTSDDVSNDNLQTIKTNLDTHKSGLEQNKGALDGLQAAVDAYDELIEQQAQNQASKPIIDRLLEIHKEKRIAYVDTVLVSIAGEVGRLYEEIHPREGLNQIALQLDPKRRASLEIESEFLTQPVPPGAYFSNSHLDSLGLCILIAIAKLEQPENAILVMDDILGSMDEPHVDNLIKLLYDESQHFLHTLVTTHYQAWHFKIRRGQLKNADCQLIELGRWNPGYGVSIINNGRSLLQILESCINDHPNEPEPIASHAGHLLEQLGDFLVSRYECSIPKKTHGNTLNDYLNGLSKKFTRHVMVHVLKNDGAYEVIQIEPILEELKEIYQVRNTSGAHYNEMASHMPVADVIRFGELVVKLGNCLMCPESGFPNKIAKGNYWATAGETRRLEPLRKP